MGEITAVAAMPKTPRAPDAQGAQGDAAAGVEAMLFAALLAQTGDGGAAGDMAGDTSQGQADAELTAPPPAVAQNSADELEDMAAMPVPPQGTLPLALLQAQFEDTDAQTQDDTADGDNALAALDAADPTETAPPPDEQETLLPAQEPKPEKNTAAKAEGDDGAADAASGNGAAAGAQVPHAATAQQTAEKPADAVTGAASAVAAALVTGAPVTGASASNAQADSAVA
ncbi:MAG TPA: hypothetical protein VL026_08495, partial [Rhizomicrobium sp.]|nr:hypothetical protein [Rhizomicrobium sp.]